MGWRGGGGGGLSIHISKGFSVYELMMYVGLHIMNNIAPCPYIDIKFESTQTDPGNKNDFCNGSFRHQTKLCHKNFKHYFTCCDHGNQSHPQEPYPNWNC